MAIPEKLQNSDDESASNISYMPGADPTRASKQELTAAEAFANLQPGHLIAGRFEIRKQIGVGGMGAVYRTHDRNRNDDIAIKVMLPELAANEAAKQRFISEAQISIKLSHQNIVNTFDVLSDGAFLFITMELLEGRSLRQDIETRKRLRKPYSEAEALGIVRPLCDALEYAHDYTIHRDVKPENVWLTTKDKVKLMDFGIARMLNGSQVNKSTSVLGTAYYMAPEQLVPSREVDHRADQYALGVMLYEMLTGQVPTGRSKAVKQLRPDVSAVVSDAVDKALEPDPDDRFADVRSFAEALGGATHAVESKKPATKARSEETSGGLMAWIHQHRAVVGTGVVLWGGVLVAGYLVQQDQVRQNRARWEKWQIDMTAAFDQTEKIKGDPELRAKAWKKYLATYSRDNPFSTQDEKLRAQAENRQHEAEDEKKSQLALARQAAQRQRGATAQAPAMPQQTYQQPPVAPQQVAQPQGQAPQGRTAEQEVGLMLLNRILR